MTGESLTPGRFNEGPDRDAARANRQEFHRWLRESTDPEAVTWRRAEYEVRAARRSQAVARRKARAAFKRKLKLDAAGAGSEGADTPRPEAPAPAVTNEHGASEKRGVEG